MSDVITQTRNRIRRSLTDEFSIMEEVYDDVASKRDRILNKLMAASEKIELVDENGKISSDIKEASMILATTLSTLRDTESSKVKIIGLKLKQQENEIASSTAAKERLEAVIKATAPGYIDDLPDFDKIEEAFVESEGIKEIKDFELKLNPRDLGE